VHGTNQQQFKTGENSGLIGLAAGGVQGEKFGQTIAYGFHLPIRMQPNLETYQDIDCSLSGANRPGFGESTFTSSKVSASPRYRKVICAQLTSRLAKLSPLLPTLRVVISKFPFGKEPKSTKPYCAESLGTGISRYWTTSGTFSIGASIACAEELAGTVTTGADSLPQETRKRQKTNGKIVSARI
jgi:hypothetical protein